MDQENKSSRKVMFDSNIKVLNMCVWKFAYAEARKSNFQQIAADHCRFQNRINKFNEIISPILNDKHFKIKKNESELTLKLKL